MVKGEKCYFMRQVDDFAVATDDEESAHWIFDKVDDGLSMPIRRMGLISLFNGVDVLQSRYYMSNTQQNGRRIWTRWEPDRSQYQPVKHTGNNSYS
jgi:hypothetical protein